MKKTFITFLSAALLAVTAVNAQSIDEGINHLNAERFTSAMDVFQKLKTAGPGNAAAIYWEGQTYFKMDDFAAAKKLFETAPDPNAPLIMVGMGQSLLHDKKVNDARQKFEAALTATRDKKGNNPDIAAAVAKANSDEKAGDAKWAVQLLEEAVNSYKKNAPAQTLLELGNAYRRAGEGTGGGKAYEAYKKALEIYPNFAIASLRLAKIFESQKNYELVLENLNDAVKRDPKFTAGFYELFYYYFYRKQYDKAEVELKNLIQSKAPMTDVSDDSYYADLCWARGDYDCAIAKDEKLVSQLGDKTNPRVYKLLADAYFKKNDLANAKKNIDKFFQKQNPDNLISFDYQLKADIISKMGATDEEVYQTYLAGAALDTVIASKIDFLKAGAKFFKDKKSFSYEAKMIDQIIAIKPKPTINDYFDLTLAHYFDNNFSKSRDAAILLQQKYPEEPYGYEWAYNNSARMITDTTRKVPQDSTALPDATKLYEFTLKDSVKYVKQYISAVQFLAAYYINEAKNKKKSLEFFEKWKAADIANADRIQSFIDQIRKMPGMPRP